VHHDPNGAMDSDVVRRTARYADTVCAYELMFGTPNALYWEEANAAPDHVYASWVQQLQRRDS
jgi:hypothetical protein